MLFAAYYFGSKTMRLNVTVPMIAIIAFIAHPVGRHVWFFTLFWTIPIIVRMLPQRYANNVLLKSVGATFTAHAVGGMLWIWTVPMTAEQWILLIPVVIYERLLFAGGIAASYLALNAVFAKALAIMKLNVPESILRVSRKFTLRV
jgi:hypothetical protein